jgi:hypothetical protein
MMLEDVAAVQRATRPSGGDVATVAIGQARLA